MSLFFSAPGLLWLLPLAVLPIALHIHARTKERVVDFPGAFFLVNPALPSAERRRRIEDFVLLALRVLLLTAAILALAGPRVKGWAVAPSSDPQAGREAVCLVLDDSPSASQRAQTREPGRDGFPDLVMRLAHVLASDPRRRVALETASGIGWPLQAGDAFVGRAGKTRWASALSGDRTLALTRGLAAFRDVVDERRVVILCSDLRRNQAEGAGESIAGRWDTALKAFHEPDAPMLLALTPDDVPARQWRIEFLDTGNETVAAQRVPVVGQPFHARLRVRCLSGAGRRELRIETASWRFDHHAARESTPAQLMLERPLILAEGQIADIDVPLLSIEPGALWVSAALSDPDEWPYDDVAATVLLVRPRRPAVLWDLRRERATRDVALHSAVFALDPLSENGRVALAQPAEARASDARPGVLVAVLHSTDGPRWSQGLSEQLRGAVEAGATILWIPDLTGDPGAWTPSLPGRTLASDPLLPRAIEGAQRCADTPDSSWRIADARTSHPLLRPFAGGRNGDLPGVHVRRRLRLAIEAEAARLQAGVEEHVLARFNDGLPALVIQRIGAGWSCQMAFGPEPEGGLAESAAWPVLLSEFLELAADDGLGATSTMGISPGLPGGRNWPIAPAAVARSARLAGPWRSKPGELRTAAVQRWSVEVPANASEIVLPSLAEPGLHRLDMQGRDLQRFLDCRIAPEESLPDALPAEVRDAITRAARVSGGATIADVADLRQALAHLQPGRPMAPFCWAFAALLMASELGLLVWRGRSG
jgi:hypothetical protein